MLNDSNPGDCFKWKRFHFLYVFSPNLLFIRSCFHYCVCCTCCSWRWKWLFHRRSNNHRNENEEEWLPKYVSLWPTKKSDWKLTTESTINENSFIIDEVTDFSCLFFSISIPYWRNYRLKIAWILRLKPPPNRKRLKRDIIITFQKTSARYIYSQSIH